MNRSAATARSYLYVPGDRPDRMDGAVGRGADAVILDLEDSVTPGRKDAARESVAGWLAGRGGSPVELWVRINATSQAADISAVLHPVLTGVVVPKAETALLSDVDKLLTGFERERGIPEGRTGVLALVETATGLASAAALATAPRVVRLGIGEVDLAAELGVRLSDDRAELTPIRLQLVVASAAARIGPPVGPTSLDFRDLDRLRASTEDLLRLGFRARTAIHPAQLATINSVLTPSADSVRRARRLVEEYERAERDGTGVVLDDHGRLVDAAVVRSAREVLSRVGHATGHATGHSG